MLFTPPPIISTKYFRMCHYVSAGLTFKHFCAMSRTCIFEQNFVHVGASVLEQFVVGVEDNDGDLAVAEDGQLVGLLHQTKLALCKRHLSKCNIFIPVAGIN